MNGEDFLLVLEEITNRHHKFYIFLIGIIILLGVVIVYVINRQNIIFTKLLDEINNKPRLDEINNKPRLDEINNNYRLEGRTPVKPPLYEYQFKYPRLDEINNNYRLEGRTPVKPPLYEYQFKYPLIEEIH
jgi:hypothetical protein